MADEPECPRCRAAPLALAFGALREDVCPACRGRFVGAETVERIVVEQHGVSHAMLRELMALFASKERLVCPSCASKMSPVHLRGVRIDLCGGCGGAWLDAGELSRVSDGRFEELTPCAAHDDDARAAAVSAGAADSGFCAPRRLPRVARAP